MLSKFAIVMFILCLEWLCAVRVTDAGGGPEYVTGSLQLLCLKITIPGLLFEFSIYQFLSFFSAEIEN